MNTEYQQIDKINLDCLRTICQTKTIFANKKKIIIYNFGWIDSILFAKSSTLNQWKKKKNDFYLWSKQIKFKIAIIWVMNESTPQVHYMIKRVRTKKKMVQLKCQSFRRRSINILYFNKSYGFMHSFIQLKSDENKLIIMSRPIYD